MIEHKDLKPTDVGRFVSYDGRAVGRLRSWTDKIGWVVFRADGKLASDAYLDYTAQSCKLEQLAFIDGPRPADSVFVIQLEYQDDGGLVGVYAKLTDAVQAYYEIRTAQAKTREAQLKGRKIEPGEYANPHCNYAVEEWTLKR